MSEIPSASICIASKDVTAVLVGVSEFRSSDPTTTISSTPAKGSAGASGAEGPLAGFVGLLAVSFATPPEELPAACAHADPADRIQATDAITSRCSVRRPRISFRFGLRTFS